MREPAEDPRITRARLSGPWEVTKDATVAELGAGGTLTVLVKGTNQWCVPRATRIPLAIRRCA